MRVWVWVWLHCNFLPQQLPTQIQFKYFLLFSFWYAMCLIKRRFEVANNSVRRTGYLAVRGYE